MKRRMRKNVKLNGRKRAREKEAEERERLDVLLVRRGLFSSRQRAKEAIKRGFIVVNGKKCEKPAESVHLDAKIEVLLPESPLIVECSEGSEGSEGSEEAFMLDVPKGFWKLREIDERFSIIKEGDVVVDLGSSAGGFLIYASRKARKVYGIEYSREFAGVLKEIEAKQGNVRVFIEDVFQFDIQKIEEECVDVILNDLTLDFASSIAALRRFLPKLRQNGKILFVHKTGTERAEQREYAEQGILSEFENSGLKVLSKLRGNAKKETYYLLVK
ncbi:MAG: methyltransferase domain-containing protein [Methanophagales archaeon]|nr:methyltransferase domain-containing protein [Methanophagales archaeon]